VLRHDQQHQNTHEDRALMRKGPIRNRFDVISTEQDKLAEGAFNHEGACGKDRKTSQRPHLGATANRVGRDKEADDHVEQSSCFPEGNVGIAAGEESPRQSQHKRYGEQQHEPPEPTAPHRQTPAGYALCEPDRERDDQKHFQRGDQRARDMKCCPDPRSEQVVAEQHQLVRPAGFEQQHQAEDHEQSDPGPPGNREQHQADHLCDERQNVEPQHQPRRDKRRKERKNREQGQAAVQGAHVPLD
jgi:hypothetical protein